MARERLHRRRRDAPPEERGDEVVAQVVPTKGIDASALASARTPDEDPTRATESLAPCERETVALHNAGALHHFVRFEESGGTYSLVLWTLDNAR